MVNFTSAAIGAFFGVITGLSLEWWKSGREDLATLCRGFCDLIAAAADAGSEFRLMAATDERSKLLSVRLVGYQNRISGYLTILTGRLHDEAIDYIKGELSSFFIALTSGDFDDPNRQVSRDAAIQVQDSSAAAIVAVRRSAYERASFRETFFRVISRSWPNGQR